MAHGKDAAAGATPVLSSRDWTSLRTWYDASGRHHLLWRVNPTPWKVLLAEVLLHRTRASAVERMYDEALKRFPGPEAIVRRPADWLQLTHPAGLTWRVQSFISTCDSLVALHGSHVPSKGTDLTSLPGIGHYIASAVRCFGFGLPEVIVDTNTVRLASRITGEPLSPSHHRSRRVRLAVASVVADGTAACARDNYALLDLASLVCRTGRPRCDRCPVVSGCVTGSRLSAGLATAGEC